jgi:hypothetical protein
MDFFTLMILLTTIVVRSNCRLWGLPYIYPLSSEK